MPSSLLLDLRGPGSLLQRIFEFLSVAEVGRAEGLCRSVYREDMPFVWERMASRIVPNEKNGGPSATLPGKDRLRRWITAKKFVNLAEQGTWDQPAVYEHDRMIYPPSDFIPSIVTRTLQHYDFFVSLALNVGEKRTILCQGFVPQNLHARDTDQSLINLSLDEILCDATIASKFPTLRRLLEGLCDPDLFSENVDTSIPARNDLQQAANGMFDHCHLTIASVDRLGECHLILSARGIAAHERFATRHRILPDIHETRRSFTFEQLGFQERPALLREDNCLARVQLSPVVCVTTIKEETSHGPMAHCQRLSLDVRDTSRRW